MSHFLVGNGQVNASAGRRVAPDTRGPDAGVASCNDPYHASRDLALEGRRAFIERASSDDRFGVGRRSVSSRAPALEVDALVFQARLSTGLSGLEDPAGALRALTALLEGTAREPPATTASVGLKSPALLRDGQAAERPRLREAAGGFAPGLSPRIDPRALVETQRTSLESLGALLDALEGVRRGYAQWRADNPTAPEPTDGERGLGEILDDPRLTAGEMSVRIVHTCLRVCPDVLEEVGAPDDLRAGVRPPRSAAEGVETQAGQAVFGVFGQIAQGLGGFLAASAPVLGPILSAALMGTPLAPIAPFVPALLPVAGMALQGVGGLAAQVGEGQVPTGDAIGSALFAQGAAGLASPDMLQTLFGALSGMFGGPAPLKPTPLPALGV